VHIPAITSISDRIITHQTGKIGVQSPSLANKNTCQPNAANAMNFLLNEVLH